MTRYRVRGIVIIVSYCDSEHCGGHDRERKVDHILETSDEDRASDLALSKEEAHRWKDEPEIWEAAPFEMTAQEERAALKRWQESVRTWTLAT